MVPLHQLLMEVLHRKVAVALPIKLVHPLELARRRTARRYLAEPPIAQPLDPVLLVANAQPAEVPSRHTQQLPGLLARQPMLLVLLEASSKRVTNTSHSIAVRRIPDLHNRRGTWRTTHVLQKADK